MSKIEKSLDSRDRPARTGNVRLIVLLVWAGIVLHAFPAAALTSPIPLGRGTKWVYEGEVVWTPIAGTYPRLPGTKLTSEDGVSWTVLKPSDGAQRAHVRWTTEVIDSFESKYGKVAVIRGYPDNLAWGEPDRPPTYCVLINITNGVYRIKARNREEALHRAREIASACRRGPDLLSEDSQILDLPLAVNKRWGGDTAREDAWYCWHVESQTQRRLTVKGAPASQPATVFTLAYRTLPDHQIVELCPGLGVIRYLYVHHGTVASADVRLVEFKRARRPPK